MTLALVFLPIKYGILLFQFKAVIILIAIKLIRNGGERWPSSSFMVEF